MDAAPRVLLIYPPVRLSVPPRVAPMGYLYLGAVLERDGIEVEILDLNALRLPMKEVLGEVRKRRFDVIGIGGMTTAYYYIKLLSLLLKREYPDTPLIGGGSACSASPDVVLTKTGVDVVCLGEGEPIITELVSCLAGKRPVQHIQGLAFRAADGSILRTAARGRFKGWTGMTFPAHHLVDMETYIRNNSEKYVEVPGLQEQVKEMGLDPVKAARPMHIFSKRGCPFGCTFCYRNFGREVVYDSPAHVVDYMEFLAERYNTCHFVFGDELFNVDQGWVTSFCELLEARGKRYLLSTNNGLRANCLTEDNIIQMKRVGFYRIGIGIESFYDPALKEMKKNQTAAQIVDAIKLTEKHGLRVDEGGMLFGYESDGWESMRENVRQLTALGRFSTNFAIPCPYPGTYLYERAKKLGLITDEEGWLMELADKDVADRVINLSRLSDEQIREIIGWGYDQLAINQHRQRHPLLAALLDRVQPIARKRFDVSVIDTLSDIRRGRLLKRLRKAVAPSVTAPTFNMDGLNITNKQGLSGLSKDMTEGQRWIVAEALAMLEKLDPSPVAPLPFLVTGSVDSTPRVARVRRTATEATN